MTVPFGNQVKNAKNPFEMANPGRVFAVQFGSYRTCVRKIS